MPIVYFDNETGLTDLYAQFDNSADDILTLPEGAGDKLRRYAVTDPQIVTLLALAAGEYNVTVRQGNYLLPSVDDPIKALIPLSWNGTTENVVPTLINAAKTSADSATAIATTGAASAATAATAAAAAASAAQSVDAKLTPARALKIDFLDRAISDIEINAGAVTIQLDSGGGVLAARIGVAQLTPEGYLEIVQGEDKRITFIVEAKGRFVSPSATEITVKFQDTKKVSQTVVNADIERVTEELDIQVFRANLTAAQTAAMAPGLAIVEIAFDTQKTVLPYAVNILPRIPGT